MNNDTAETRVDESGGALFGAEPALPGFAPQPAAQTPYRVLARKYRPSHFGDLIGQDAMVRTLTNAFSSNRIPQAWMLTGVRGVGKTTTARILARALNFQRVDGSGGPTTDLAEMGINCQSIIEGRHIDVMEIDAASNNGIDNIRQINDSVRYAPVSARYKVYIIDEVHMMSGPAFNAFLKTLEEPPPHAKFIFATTEIRKVPVTILSRCQRFDLRRVDAGLLARHLAQICVKEAVAVDAEALALIARAAEGSVRDSLSLLDQAISHGAGMAGADDVRAMLGLADRARVVDLFGMAVRGDLGGALGEMKHQYDAGADPLAVMTELASFIHLVTRLKVTPEAASDPALTEIEKKSGLEFSSVLTMRTLSMLWQVLTRGLGDIRDAQRPLPAAEMLMVRLCHAADLPTPDEALRALRDGQQDGPQDNAQDRPRNGQGVGPGPIARSAFPAPSSPHPANLSPSSSAAAVQAIPMQDARVQAQAEPAAGASPALRLSRFEDVVAFAGQMRDLQLKRCLECDVRLVSFVEGRIELVMERTAPRQLANDLSQRLQQWTGRAWMISVVSGAMATDAASTLNQTKAAGEAEARVRAGAHPAVRAALAMFTGATLGPIIARGEFLPAPEPVFRDDTPDIGLPSRMEDDEGWPDETGFPAVGDDGCLDD